MYNDPLKGSINALIATLIITVVGAGAAYFLVQQSYEPVLEEPLPTVQRVSPAPSVSSVPADWKTYRTLNYETPQYLLS